MSEPVAKKATAAELREEFIEGVLDELPTKYCNACAHAVVEAAEARAEKAEGERGQYRAALDKINVIRNSIVGLQRIGWSEHIYPLVAALDAAGIDGIGYGRAKPEFEGLLDRACKAEDAAKAATSELAEARRQLGEAVEVQEDLAGKLFDAVRERDALKAGKWAGAWRWDDTGEWCSRHRPNEDVHTVELAMRGTGFMWRFRFEAGEQAGSLDAAKAAADAHLVANGWWLENSK